MPQSKVDICNLALAHLGLESIRSIDEDNKRARMAKVFFDSLRDQLLTKFDWPFARRYKKLSALDLDESEIPSNLYPYALPAGCLVPRDIAPRGSSTRWIILGSDRGPTLFCETAAGEDGIYLYYTHQEVNPAAFSTTFSFLLGLGMAVFMSPALTGTRSLTKQLNDQFIVEQSNVWEADANGENDYISYDSDPENDKFVNPD